jgi:hypothetical protein
VLLLFRGEGRFSCDPGVSGFQPTHDYILGLIGEQATECGTVAIVGCDSGNLASQYSGADNFVGVDSGLGTGQPGAAALETSIPGLLAAGSTFVDSLASGSSLPDAVSAANKVIDQQPKTDTGDQVIQQTKPQ